MQTPISMAVPTATPMAYLARPRSERKRIVPKIATEATEPDCASLQASRSTRRSTVLQLQSQAACEMGSGVCREILGAQRIGRNGLAWLRCPVKPALDHRPPRFAELRDRECRRRSLPRRHENRPTVPAAVILARSQGSDRHRPENGNSSLLQRP